MTNPKSTSATPAYSNSTRIINQSTCKLISPAAKGVLTYNIGYNDLSKSLHFRVIANTNGSFFSNERIALDDVIALIYQFAFSLLEVERPTMQ